MIYSTQELYLKYKDYKTPHVKIQTEVRNERLFPVVRGLYEDDRNTEGYLLTSYIRPGAYLSFEYALSFYGLIPERVSVYTAATAGKAHSKFVSTTVGTFRFQDVPKAVYRYGVKGLEENGYGYLMASPEKALCDLLCKKIPVGSMREFESLLFDDLRVDKTGLFGLKKEDIGFLCPLYRKKNLLFLNRYMEGLK